MPAIDIDNFDTTIGLLDRILSILVLRGQGKVLPPLDLADIQTLKHHAEDMILAGQKILKDLGYEDHPLTAKGK